MIPIEHIFSIIAVGIIAIINIYALSKLDKRMSKLSLHIGKFMAGTDNYIEELRNDVVDIENRQHRKTRKETQEIKSRLTQVTKDLNTIEKLLKKGVKK